MVRISGPAGTGARRHSAAQGWELTRQAAKYIANAMAYDDVIRVADEKTRAARFARIRKPRWAAGDVMQLTDYTHPRGEEIVSIAARAVGALDPRAAPAFGVD
jgi:indolepyruvate ferredoxin oxidoreductase, beta subunit